ncbi:MAG: acetoacetate--CoA ligase [Bacteroidetes bacterium]|nr:acetoacetate--CoA ligase [Bacteroidota bacterium]
MRPDTLWTPSGDFTSNSNMQHFCDWLNDKKGRSFNDYESLRKWSVDDLEGFWKAIWDYYDIIAHDQPSAVIKKPDQGMIGTQWFPDSTLNYAEHIFRNRQDAQPAILFQSERHDLKEVSWNELQQQVASMADYLRKAGVGKGDRVASFMPNIPEVIVAFLAANSIGAIWSSCSPDFGAASVIERFSQIEPKVIFIADGYSYNGRNFSRQEANTAICEALPCLEKIIFLPYLDESAKPDYLNTAIHWDETQEHPETPLTFTPVPFDHPIWVLYSSGTTGKPKAITHSTGGNLIEHYKALGLHQNCKPGDRFFWYSTTGWMMWNYAVASMLTGATVCIYDGAAAYPDLNVLWDFAREAAVNHFGAGASFYIACMKEGLDYVNGPDTIPSLQSLGSTGSPLTPEAFQWIYSNVKQDLWLISLSGGTDVCSGFVGGNPYDPVYKGEIQCRMLGCDLQAWNEAGKAVIGEVGEMVITQSMPSMPVFFWGDDDNKRYRSSYFEMYPDVWRHGDWIMVTERGTLIIYGRSDATLNRGGVRIGTSEVYSAVDGLEEIKDSLVICIDKEDGSQVMPLFVVLKENVDLSDDLKKKINSTLRSQFSPRHVPDLIYAVDDVPYTISGKKMETPVKKILCGIDISNSISKDAMKNPESLDVFIEMTGKL